MFFRKRTDYKSLTDEELVNRYRAREDSHCLGVLFERYTHVVFLVCMKYLKNEAESEDVSMQIFEKLMRDLKKYEVKAFKYWLHTVTKNQCLAYLDKKKRQRHKEDQFEAAAQAQAEQEPEWQWLGEEQDKEAMLVQMEQAMQLLKEEQKKCLTLFYLQQKSYQEVSELTGYSMKQVKSYIQNGKRNLRIKMEKISTETAIE